MITRPMMYLKYASEIALRLMVVVVFKDELIKVRQFQHALSINH